MNIGAAVTACFGDNSVRPRRLQEDFQGFRGFSFRSGAVRSAFFADMFGSLLFTAQHGNFQKLFFDLTRFHARLDFPSGSKFLSGATQLAQDFVNSQQPSLNALQAVCPNTFISLQQQVTEFYLQYLIFIILFLIVSSLVTDFHKKQMKLF